MKDIDGLAKATPFKEKQRKMKADKAKRTDDYMAKKIRYLEAKRLDKQALLRYTQENEQRYQPMTEEATKQKTKINGHAVDFVDPKPINYDYFTDEDAEEMARLNPEVAFMLGDPETIQAIRDAKSKQNLNCPDRYNKD